MKPNLWAIPGIFMFYGASVEAKVHKHNAIQIVWPSANSSTTILETQIITPLVIASDIEHRLVMQEGWVILVEPQSWLGVLLAKYLQGATFREIANLAYFSPAKKQLMVHSTTPIALLSPLLRCLNINWQQTAELLNIEGKQIDS